MPLTNAEKQKRARDRAKAKLERYERYETALRNIVEVTDRLDQAHVLANAALNKDAG